MRFESYVAFRYLRGKRKTRFISLITLISVAGVSVGVIALIVVMSVMTGFDNALRKTIIGNRAHLTIMDRYEPIMDHEAVIREIEALNPEIIASGPIIEVEALLSAGPKRSRRTTGALIIGVDPQREEKVTQLAENLTDKDGRRYGRGELPGKGEVVLGYILAGDRLRVTVGEEIEAITSNAKITPFGLRPGQQKWLTVSGIFQAQMSEYDLIYGFTDIPTARMLKGSKGVDAVHCKLTDPFLADKVKKRIETELGYRVKTWYDSQMAFFEALKQEKLAMFIILVFIILVAAFNITSTLIMVVMEKRRDIGILRTIGVSQRSILKLFVLEGLLIGLSGTVAGVILGTLLAYNLNPVAEFIAGIFNIDLFNSTIYYFDHIPSDVVWSDVGVITLASVVLTFVSTLYPAWSAARVDPVEALRYE